MTSYFDELQENPNPTYKYLLYDTLEEATARGKQHTGGEWIDMPLLLTTENKFALDVTFVQLTDEEENNTVGELNLTHNYEEESEIQSVIEGEHIVYGDEAEEE